MRSDRVCFPLQGDDQQQGEGDCCSGAQLRQLQPAAAERGTRGAQQQHGGLPDRLVNSTDTHTQKNHGPVIIYPRHSRPHSLD